MFGKLFNDDSIGAEEAQPAAKLAVKEPEEPKMSASEL